MLWITKATHTLIHPQYVTFTAIPLRQLLHECDSMLCYRSIACLVILNSLYSCWSLRKTVSTASLVLLTVFPLYLTVIDIKICHTTVTSFTLLNMKLESQLFIILWYRVSLGAFVLITSQYSHYWKESWNEPKANECRVIYRTQVFYNTNNIDNQLDTTITVY